MIPRIHVDARVIPVGVEPSGAMASPDNPHDVGWWKDGTSPGENGSAVIGGHVDFAGYGAAVFWDLRLLKPGDQIQVTSGDGSRRTFAVTEVVSYAFDDSGLVDRVFSAVDRKDLNLVTCAGTFNARTHNYDKRLIVYSTLVE